MNYKRIERLGKIFTTNIRIKLTWPYFFYYAIKLYIFVFDSMQILNLIVDINNKMVSLLHYIFCLSLGCYKDDNYIFFKYYL